MMICSYMPKLKSKYIAASKIEQHEVARNEHKKGTNWIEQVIKFMGKK